MSVLDNIDSFMKSVQVNFKISKAEVFSKLDLLIEDNLNMASGSTLEISLETIKEVAFGGVLGMCAGYAAKRTAAPFIVGAASASFMLLRGAIFDGHIQANWSPLSIDDASFAR